MDLRTFIVELVSALAWPIAFLVFAAFFRRELRVLLGRVKKGKIGPAEFEFEATVAAIRERVGSPESSPEKLPKTLVDLANEEPRAVIIKAWLEIQEVVQSIVATHATNDDLSKTRSTTLHVLHRILRDKPEYIDVYNDLKSLRNQAVHEVDFSPRPSSVIEYAELSQELLLILRPYAGDK